MPLGNNYAAAQHYSVVCQRQLLPARQTPLAGTGHSGYTRKYLARQGRDKRGNGTVFYA